jgi:dTDP-4-dehydrorhamnose 3,5-epimerase
VERPRAAEVPIADVVLVPLLVHPDERGSLTETYRRAWLPGSGEIVQVNVSRSRAGVLRGLHVHRQQADFWVVLSGVAFVGLFDLRAGTPSTGRKAELRIDAESRPLGLYIPPRVAHGFYAERDVLLQYLVDRPYAGDDEWGLAWNDAEVGIDWPTESPVLSARDRANPPLREVMEALRGPEPS